MMDRRVEVSRNIKATPWRRHLPYHASYLIKVLNFVQTHHLCRRRSLSVQLFKLYFQTAPDSKTFCTPRYFLTMICTRSILWIMNFYVLCINVQSCIWCVIVVLAVYLPTLKNNTCSKSNQVSSFVPEPARVLASLFVVLQASKRRMQERTTTDQKSGKNDKSDKDKNKKQGKGDKNDKSDKKDKHDAQASDWWSRRVQQL